MPGAQGQCLVDDPSLAGMQSRIHMRPKSYMSYPSPTIIKWARERVVWHNQYTSIADHNNYSRDNMPQAV